MTTEFKPWKQTAFHQGTPALVTLLNQQPVIKEKYLKSHELIDKSVFKGRILLSVYYKNDICMFHMRIDNKTHAQRNYAKRYKNLLKELLDKLIPYSSFNVV
jgi:hypothetical protein